MDEKMFVPASTVVSCCAPYGGGGLGQHLTQLVEDARVQGILSHYYASAIRDGDAAGRIVDVRLTSWLNSYTPARFSPGWKNHLGNELWDRAVAARLEPAHTFTGFVGQALKSFQRARQLRYQNLELQAANSHVNNVARRHTVAISRFGIETSWLNEAQHRKTLREYDAADAIYVASEYTRQSFLAEGVTPSKLYKRTLDVQSRFKAPHLPPTDDVFRVVYCGSLTVMKGIPVLIEAFSRLSGGRVELILVGGWATRGMRRYLQSWLQRDARIHIAPGDPLPYLQRADVYVHPSFNDGFAYAPMEALAVGVPVIVTEDTGMKEHVREGVNGYVVPTGDWEAILERLEFLRQARLVVEAS